MSKRLITVLALAMLTVTGALADDHAKLSVTYEVVAQQVEEVKRKDKDLMRLDIREHASQFRSVIIEWVLDNGLIYGSPTSLNHPFKGYTWLEYHVVKKHSIKVDASILKTIDPKTIDHMDVIKKKPGQKHKVFMFTKK